MSRGLNFIGQFWGCLGIPNHTRSFANSLIKNLDDTNLVPLQPNHNDDKYGLTEKILTSINKPENEYPTLCFWYPQTYRDLLKDTPKGKRIGYYIFEYTKIPESYVKEINDVLDAVCTASKWGAKVLKDNGVTIPIHVIPGGAEHEKFNSSGRNLDEKRFRFLHMGKAENRKGTETVIRAFNQAFRGNRKVRLSLFIDNPHLRDFNADMFLHNIQRDYSLEYPVTNIDIRHFEDDIVSIYNTHHVAVFGSKAEGIGLPIVEAMSCGLPTIVPFNSGITEYATDENSIRLMDLKEEPVYDMKFFPAKGEFGIWNSPTVEEMLDKMVWAHENWNEARDIGNRAEEYMKTKYTWDLAAKKFLEELIR